MPRDLQFARCMSKYDNMHLCLYAYIYTCYMCASHIILGIDCNLNRRIEKLDYVGIETFVTIRQFQKKFPDEQPKTSLILKQSNTR